MHYGAMGIFFSVLLFLIAPSWRFFSYASSPGDPARPFAGFIHKIIFRGAVCIIQRRLDFVRSAIPALAGSVIYVCMAVFLAWSGSGSGVLSGPYWKFICFDGA